MSDFRLEDICCTHSILGGSAWSDDLGVCTRPAWPALLVPGGELTLRAPAPSLDMHTHTQVNNMQHANLWVKRDVWFKKRK